MQAKPIKHVRGEATRLAILEAAEQVFANVGFQAARLEDVALAVGIRRPSITYYFANKQELYDAVEASIFAAMHEAAVKGMSGATTHSDRLTGLLGGWLDFQINRPTAARIILRLVADVAPRGGNPTQFSSVLLEDIEQVVADGVAAGEFQAISPTMIVNAVASTMLFYVCNGEQMGGGRQYDPADPALLQEFRTILHQTARAVVGAVPVAASVPASTPASVEQVMTQPADEVILEIPQDISADDERRIARWAQIFGNTDPQSKG